MKRPLLNAALVLIATLALPAPGVRGADAAATNTTASTTGPGASISTGAATTPAASGFDAFRLIADRNIFNPNRSGRTPERESTRREPERRVRTESIALVGTMSYEHGLFAFFDGSSFDYRRAVKRSDTIAGLTVASVTSQQVVLRSSATNENEITLPLGMQLQRHDEGKWEVTARPESSSSSSTTTASSTSSGSGGGSDDVLKRLMQQREQDGAAATSAPAPTPTPTPATESPAAAGNPGSGSSGTENDILKRLMQRREKGE